MAADIADGCNHSLTEAGGPFPLRIRWRAADVGCGSFKAPGPPRKSTKFRLETDYPAGNRGSLSPVVPADQWPEARSVGMPDTGAVKRFAFRSH